MHRSRHARLVASLLTILLLATQVASVAAAPPGGTSKGISVSAAGLDGLGSFMVSAGEAIPLTITVANDGKQTINDVRLRVGKDGDPTSAANGDANPPIDLPTGVTASAQGCTGGALLVCEIGTLRARQSVTYEVLLSAVEHAGAIAEFGTKATVTVAEGGSDNGGNLDSFSIEGLLAILAFSCESTSVYRPSGSDKQVDTCGVLDERNTNGQSALVSLPSRLSTMTLRENADGFCPEVSGLTCIGDEVEASIVGDGSGDTISWTIEVLLGDQRVTLNKLVVYHYSDTDALVEAIPLTRKNACKTSTQQGCGSAEIVDGVLIITVQTEGNGKTRILN